MPKTRRLLPRLLMALLPAAAALPAQAQTEAATAAALREQAPLRVELTQTTVAPAVTAVPAPGQSAGFDTATQTTLWAGSARAAIGLGVQQPWRAPAWAAPARADTARDGQLLLALALKTSTHSRLIWQTEPLAATSADGSAAPPPLALDLRHSNPYRSLLRGSLRMQLGRDTALTLKPRGRRIGVALSSQW
jgi:hypothetical protein